MLARTPCPAFVFHHRRRWQRVVPVVRRLDALGRPHWDIAARLHISRAYVARALKDGAGIWSPEEWARMTRAAREAGR